MFDYFVADEGKREQFEFLVAATILTPGCCGALDVDIGDVNPLLLFEL